MKNTPKSVREAVDPDASGQNRNLKDSFNVWIREGTAVQKRWRLWLSLTGCLCLILAGGAAALLCWSHPLPHDSADPLPCMESNKPAMQSDTGSMRLIEGRRIRALSKCPIPLLHSAVMGMSLASSFDWSTSVFFWPQERPRLFTSVPYPAVLRL
jgi:hypothetical protein